MLGRDLINQGFDEVDVLSRLSIRIQLPRPLVGRYKLSYRKGEDDSLFFRQLFKMTLLWKDPAPCITANRHHHERRGAIGWIGRNIEVILPLHAVHYDVG